MEWSLSSKIQGEDVEEVGVEKIHHNSCSIMYVNYSISLSNLIVQIPGIISTPPNSKKPCTLV